jgi:hypothetical protein
MIRAHRSAKHEALPLTISMVLKQQPFSGARLSPASVRTGTHTGACRPHWNPWYWRVVHLSWLTF